MLRRLMMDMFRIIPLLLCVSVLEDIRSLRCVGTVPEGSKLRQLGAGRLYLLAAGGGAEPEPLGGGGRGMDSDDEYLPVRPALAHCLCAVTVSCVPPSPTNGREISSTASTS